MKNKNPISQDFIKAAKSAHDEYIKNYDEKILDRITYIIETYVSLWDNKLSTWYFHDAPEGEAGNFWENHDEYKVHSLLIEDRHISDGKTANHNTEYILLDKNNKEIEIFDSFPVRWLWEDFEQELIEGKAKYESKQLEKASAKQQKKQKWLNSAKAKLSKAELKALKS